MDRHDLLDELADEMLVAEMLASGIDKTFVERAFEQAKEYEGIRELMFLWSEARGAGDRGEEAACLAAIAEHLAEHE